MTVFHGWNRCIGVALLVVALVLVMVWGRSQNTHDCVTIPIGGHRELGFESYQGEIALSVLVSPDGVIGPDLEVDEFRPTWLSFSIADWEPKPSYDDVTGVLFEGFGIRFEQFRYIRNAQNLGLSIQVPYFAFGLPLTLLAAWLLLKGRMLERTNFVTMPLEVKKREFRLPHSMLLPCGIRSHDQGPPR